MNFNILLCIYKGIYKYLKCVMYMKHLSTVNVIFMCHQWTKTIIIKWKWKTKNDLGTGGRCVRKRSGIKESRYVKYMYPIPKMSKNYMYSKHVWTIFLIVLWLQEFSLCALAVLMVFTFNTVLWFILIKLWYRVRI